MHDVSSPPLAAGSFFLSHRKFLRKSRNVVPQGMYEKGMG